MTVAPYFRDEGAGGLVLVVPRPGGDAEVLPLPPMVVWRLVTAGLMWLQRAAERGPPG